MPSAFWHPGGYSWTCEVNPWLLVENMRPVPVGMPTGWNTQDRHCRLLDMPSEIILKIKTFLPHESKVALSITCKQLKDISDENFKSQGQFLSLLARDIPDGVPCYFPKCNIIHRPISLNTRCPVDVNYSNAITHMVPLPSTLPSILPSPYYQLTQLLAKTIALGPSRQEYILGILDQMTNHWFRETIPTKSTKCWSNYAGLFSMDLLVATRAVQIETSFSAKVVDSKLLTKTQSIIFPKMFSRAWSDLTMDKLDPTRYIETTCMASYALDREVFQEAHRITDCCDLDFPVPRESVGSRRLSRREPGPVILSTPWLHTKSRREEVMQIDKTCINFCNNVVSIPGLGTGIAITVWRDHGGFGTENAWRWWRHFGRWSFQAGEFYYRTPLEPSPAWSYDEVDVAIRFEGKLGSKPGIEGTRDLTVYTPQITTSDYARIQEAYNKLSWVDLLRGCIQWCVDTVASRLVTFWYWIWTECRGSYARRPPYVPHSIFSDDFLKRYLRY